ncbi:MULTISPECIES: thioredoxin family protein [Bacillus cereus group]|uniref:thioredoxin family protein n=1 Tax=Bacillus cereus group TaxID=86661 RepID=UPI0020D2632A|nr:MULTISPECIES: thioredoxin family protein [Bacillus cereus group]
MGCPACEELEPTLNKVIKEINITIDSIEMSKNRNSHKDYFVENNIDSTPMLIHYKNGKENARLSNQIITEKI